MAYKNDFELEEKRISMSKILLNDDFFAETFPVYEMDLKKLHITELLTGLWELSEKFSFGFENTGVMKDGVIYTFKITPKYDGKQITLGDIMETGDVDEQYFIPTEKLYYTDPSVTHSDETHGKLPKEDCQTWQYLKGVKKLSRKAASGHEYIFSEGASSMVDAYNKPARTTLTSEGSFSRTPHIVEDKKTKRIRLITTCEAERIHGFLTDHTKYCLVDGDVIEMPVKKRRFMMGNDLVVNLIKQMEPLLSKIFDAED